VMWCADPGNAGEDYRKSVPLVFKPADVRDIRHTANP